MAGVRLGARLEAVASLAGTCVSVADIGTDHAYLPLALVQRGMAERAIASDRNPGPCEAARRSVDAAGEGHRVEIRLGDGISVLAPGEAETICIAGMGGTQMASILAAVPRVLAQASRLVLQPMNRAKLLREWVYRAGWHIEEEALAEEGWHVYEAFSACKGEQPMPSPILLKVGPILWREKPPLLRRHIEKLLSSAQRRAKGLARSPRSRWGSEHLAALDEILQLEEMLGWQNAKS